MFCLFFSFTPNRSFTRSSDSVLFFLCSVFVAVLSRTRDMIAADHPPLRFSLDLICGVCCRRLMAEMEASVLRSFHARVMLGRDEQTLNGAPESCLILATCFCLDLVVVVCFVSAPFLPYATAFRSPLLSLSFSLSPTPLHRSFLADGAVHTYSHDTLAQSLKIHRIFYLGCSCFFVPVGVDEGMRRPSTAF